MLDALHHLWKVEGLDRDLLIHQVSYNNVVAVLFKEYKYLLLIVHVEPCGQCVPQSPEP